MSSAGMRVLQVIHDFTPEGNDGSEVIARSLVCSARLGSNGGWLMMFERLDAGT